VINDQIDGHEGVDLGRVTTEALHSISHGSKIDNCGYTSEILKDDSRGSEGDFSVVLRVLDPVEDLLDVGLFDTEVIAVAHCTFEENTD
jgi:hypothetical protein